MPGYSFEKTRCWIDEFGPNNVQLKNPTQYTKQNKSTLNPTHIIDDKLSESNYTSTQVGICKVLLKMLNISKINFDHDIYMLGIDSITFSKLIIELENYFNIFFEDEFLDYDAFSNLTNLVNYIDSRRNAM